MNSYLFLSTQWENHTGFNHKCVLIHLKDNTTIFHKWESFFCFNNLKNSKSHY